MSNDFQHTAEWFEARIGCLTGSRCAAVLARGTKGQKLKGYADLVKEITAERILGVAVEHFTTDAMKWGTDHEDEARMAYEMATGADVKLVGFLKHPTVPYLGASPDGVVGEDGLIEIKCPNAFTHISRIGDGVVPEEYKAQMLCQLIVTGRKWCDFVDYDPRLLPRFPQSCLWVIRYEPTQEERDAALEAFEEFLNVVETETARLIEILRRQKNGINL